MAHVEVQEPCHCRNIERYQRVVAAYACHIDQLSSFSTVGYSGSGHRHSCPALTLTTMVG